MRSWVEISRSRIRENCRLVLEATQGLTEVMAVVKADAYGHGAIEVSRLLEAEGVSWLAVSNIGEGIALREAGITARILVMADFLPEETPVWAPFHLTPVIHSLDDLERVRVPYHLKIDSGMGRLGTRAAPQEIVQRVAAAHAPLEGLMTHFASSGNYESPQTSQQIQHFENVTGAFEARGLSPKYGASFEHHAGCVPPHGSLGKSGAAGPCHLRLHIRGARPFTGVNSTRATRTDVESHGARRERFGGRRADRLWRYLSCDAADADCSTRGWIRRRHPS